MNPTRGGHHTLEAADGVGASNEMSCYEAWNGCITLISGPDDARHCSTTYTQCNEKMSAAELASGNGSSGGDDDEDDTDTAPPLRSTDVESVRAGANIPTTSNEDDETKDEDRMACLSGNCGLEMDACNADVGCASWFAESIDEEVSEGTEPLSQNLYSCAMIFCDFGDDDFKGPRTGITVSVLAEMYQGDATTCYIALLDGPCDDANVNGGVYKISEGWYSNHFGGPIIQARCGQYVENWNSKSGGHNSYTANLVDKSDLGKRAVYFADFLCAPSATPASAPSPASAPVAPSPTPAPTPVPATPSPIPSPTPAPVTPAPAPTPVPTPVRCLCLFFNGTIVRA
jgi:hypothetical protein